MRIHAWRNRWLLLLAPAWACSSSQKASDPTSTTTAGASLTTSSGEATSSTTTASTATTNTATTSGGTSAGAVSGSVTNGNTDTGSSTGSGGNANGTGTQTGSSISSGGANTTTSTATGSVTSTTSDASGGTGGSTGGSLAWTQGDGLWTGVRYYTGSTPSNRTSGPAQGPVREFVLTNTSASATKVDVSLTGADAERFQLSAPVSLPTTLEPNGSLTVELELVTDNAALPPAPAQDDGATVMRAELTAISPDDMATLDMYALVLTYVELEPTFGQLMDAFPYEVNLGAALENDANPNPTTLPGVESGTDEVAAPSFVKAVQDQPVTMIPLARFSPPGQVPYGWYPPGNPGQSQQVAMLGEQNDPHTNNQSRMLEPPLAEGTGEFDPGSAPFGIFMEPDGQAIIYSEDSQNSDKQHRLKVFVVHDKSGTLIENTYLLGGEEASNGDYQDYVFLLSNVTLP